MPDVLNMSEIIVTIAVLTGLIILRLFLVRMIKRRSPILDKAQRRWLSRINNTTIILAFIIVVFIWAPQLHTFALSLTAVAVAIVITTKEILMCLTGGFLRAAMKPFEIGHWISIDGMTGEVMSINALGTVIQEVDTQTRTYQFTGRTIEIPNSKFLTMHVENLNFFKHYIYHDIVIAVQQDSVDATVSLDTLQTLADTYYQPFHKDAVAFNKKIEKKTAIDFADPGPQSFLRTTDLGHYVFTVQMLLPTLKAIQIDTAIKKDFLSFVHEHKKQNKADEAAKENTKND
tara:strand:+ start:1019 stop:1882 length:864 start_codon:yes stop_codon:yes gene_type:complete